MSTLSVLRPGQTREDAMPVDDQLGAVMGGYAASKAAAEITLRSQRKVVGCVWFDFVC